MSESNVTDDDDLVAQYDLSAWDVPAVPAKIADGVIARMVATDDAIATSVQRRRARRWLLVGGVAAGTLAVSMGVWIGMRHGERTTTSGSALVDKPRHLELGSVSANLDPGADVRWSRSSGLVQVGQRAGDATWHVEGGDRLVIDAGATVASVEASGASLRVEVRMNRSDARVVGASALTSAAVAMITVFVYEGHVRVTAAGQTVVVQPGSRVEVEPGGPPHEPLNVGASMVMAPKPPNPDADVTIVAGESPTIHDPLGNPVVEIQGLCKTATDIRLTPAPAGVLDDNGLATLPTGHYTYEIRCDGSATPTVGTIDVVTDPATAPLISAARGPIARIEFPIEGDRFTTDVHVAGDTIDGASVSISGLGVVVDNHHRFVGDVATPTVAIRIMHPQRGLHYFIRHLAGVRRQATVPSCDDDALRRAGNDALAVGNPAQALVSYDDALRCKPDVRTTQLAFMAACQAHQPTKASVYWKRFGPDVQTRVLQICVRNGITREALDGTIDGDTQTGTLVIGSTPPAHILIDGKDTGKITPVSGLELVPGKHKVTFVINDDRYTFPVTIKAGETEKIVKQLE